MKPLKLGTRKSVLARAQSQLIANKINVPVELHGVVTAGDQNQSIALSKMEGRDFFVAELDRSLLNRQVDFAVHSMKDLSLERPPDLLLAAVPPREDPRDVVIFSHRKPSGPRKIGTSAPRRLENVPHFFNEVHFPASQFLEIRGNVTTRLKRLDQDLDGVVLALAGLIRLWKDPEARELISPLLANKTWVILPLTRCPSAPSQGALAVECRGEDQDLARTLAALDHEPTREKVAREKEVLARWGGGCHQQFGTTAFEVRGLGIVQTTVGRTPQGERLDEWEWNRPPSPQGQVRPWDGRAWRKKTHTILPLPCKRPKFEGAFFVAHWRALPEDWITPLGEATATGRARVWVSGVASWRVLQEKGVWVEGCAEGFGYDHITPLLAEPVLQLPPAHDWTLLTHQIGRDTWGPLSGRVLATYRLYPTDEANQAKQEISQATHVFWSSRSQFDMFKSSLKNTQPHQACGPGKTADFLKKTGMRVTVFPSVEEWRKWITP